MEKYIVYKRVSTDSQGIRGLGMDAQSESIAKSITKESIIAEFTEVESGKNKNRPELNKAIERCKKENATLVVAKLDRLSRSVSFLFNLRDSGVKFRCLDLPEMNTLTLGLFAVFAEYEREKISIRTKEALAALKAKGVKLGNPYIKHTVRVKAKGISTTTNQSLKPYIQSLKQNGLSYQEIANRLNSEGKTTTCNRIFSKSQVQYLLK